MEKTQFNDSKVSQLFYYDPITDSYIPVSSLNPLPVHVDTTATVVIPTSLIVNQPTGTNLHAVLDSGSITSITNPVHVLPDTSNVSIQGIVNTVNNFAPGTMDVFGGLVAGQRNNQIEVSFMSGLIEDLVVPSTTGTGNITITGGHAVFSTGTGGTAEAKGVTFGRTFYKPGHEVYALFTAFFTTPTDVNSFQRIGHYDSSNGFFIGYEGLNFGITKRSGATDVFTARAEFNGDNLIGLTDSKFTRNGIPEALDLTKLNVFRIRFGWLGSANIYFEVLSPDGVWVIFHNMRQPNSSNVPSIQDPDNPISIDVSKSGSDSTELIVATACWAAGVVTDLNGVDNIIVKQITGVSQQVTLDIQAGTSSVAAQITGTWSGGFNFEVSVDGINFVSQTVGNEGNGTTQTYALGNGVYTAPVGGMQKFRIISFLWVSGTAVVTIRSTTGVHAVMIIESIPPGVNYIGQVGTVPPPDAGFVGSFDGVDQIFGPAPIINGYSTGLVSVSGVWSGEILVETTVDFATFNTQNLISQSLSVQSITQNGIYTFATTGLLFLKLTTTSWSSGSANFQVQVSASVGQVIVENPVTVVQPIGSNLHVIQDNSAVVGIFSDNSVNSNSKIPTLACVANTNNPAWQEGYQVPLSVDTSGNTRVVLAPSQTVGLKPFHLVSAASTNATLLKSKPGQVYGWDINSSITGYRKVVFHDTSSLPVAGSNVFFTIGIDSSSRSNTLGAVGITFSAGIGMTTVTGHSDVDSSAVGSQNLDINVFYI